MTKRQLLEILKPFTDDLQIDVAIGPYCRGVISSAYELVHGEGHLVLCVDRGSDVLITGMSDFNPPPIKLRDLDAKT